MKCDEKYGLLKALAGEIEPQESTVAEIERLFSNLSPREYLKIYELALREEPKIIAQEPAFGGENSARCTFDYLQLTCILTAYAGKILQTSKEREKEKYFRNHARDFLDLMLRTRITPREPV